MDRMNYDEPGYGCVGVTVEVRLGSDLREWWGGYTTMQDHMSNHRNNLSKLHPNWNLQENLTRAARRSRNDLEGTDKDYATSRAAGARTAPLVEAGLLRGGVRKRKMVISPCVRLSTLQAICNNP